MSGHTPGPYLVRPHWHDSERREVAPTYGGEVPLAGDWAAIAEVSGVDEEEAEANARLIAAAPDLLAELEAARHELTRLRDIVGDLDAEIIDAVVAGADAALAKARGHD